MNVVAVHEEDLKIFESQKYISDYDKNKIENAILNDAFTLGIGIKLLYITDEELNAYIVT